MPDGTHTVQIPIVGQAPPMPLAASAKQQSLPNLSELFLGKENVIKREGKWRIVVSNAQAPANIITRQKSKQINYYQEVVDPLMRMGNFITYLSEWVSQPGPKEPLSTLQVHDLCSEVVKLRQQKLLHRCDHLLCNHHSPRSIPEEDLQQLISILRVQVQMSSQIHLKHKGEQVFWLFCTRLTFKQTTSESGDYLFVMSGFESTLVILNVMITENIPKSVISEEVTMKHVTPLTT